MKIQKTSFLSYKLLTLALVLLGCFFICKSSAYADEQSLVTLQKDVLAAKQKQLGFEDQTQVVGRALGDSKSLQLQQEAERLILELEKPIYPSITSKEVAPAQFKFPSPRSFQTRPDLEPRKPWVFNPMPKIFGFGREDAYKISDGEAIYKVAVSDGKISVHEAVDIAVANSIQLQALKKKVSA